MTKYPQHPDVDQLSPEAKEAIATADITGIHVNDLPKEDPMKIIGAEIVREFDTGIDYLRSEFPNQRINAVTDLAWKAIHNKIINFAIADVPTMAMSVTRAPTSSGLMAILLCPPNWAKLVKVQKHHEYGAIVFNASQARDFMRGRIQPFGGEPFDTIVSRARMYEAEYILTLKKTDPDFRPSVYFDEILQEFPEGMDSDAAIRLIA